MYGYTVPDGFKGWVDGKWMLFPTDTEYYAYMRELED